MPALAFLILTFIITFLGAAIAVGVLWIFLEQRAPKEGARLLGGNGGEDSGPLLLKRDVLSTISFWSVLLARFAYADVIRTKLAEAGLSWSVGRLTAMMMFSGVVVLAMLVRFLWVPLWAATAGALIGAHLPYFWVLHQRSVRLRKMEEQLPDALDALARALRAGHPFGTAMEVLVRDSLPPLAGEFAKAVDERRLGMSWEQVFENLCRRVPVDEMGLFSAAAQIQSRAGGRLNEVLARIADNLRESSALRGEVQAISAHGRLSGAVLTAIPAAIVLILAVVNPAHMDVLLRHPYGKHMLAAAGIGLVTAHLVIRKLVDIRL